MLYCYYFLRMGGASRVRLTRTMQTMTMKLQETSFFRPLPVYPKRPLLQFLIAWTMTVSYLNFLCYIMLYYVIFRYIITVIFVFVSCECDNFCRMGGKKGAHCQRKHFARKRQFSWFRIKSRLVQAAMKTSKILKLITFYQ